MQKIKGVTDAKSLLKEIKKEIIQKNEVQLELEQEIPDQRLQLKLNPK